MRKKEKYYHVVEYMGGAVYEPAEGGYYVPVTEICYISDKRYKEKHAIRELKKAMADYVEYYGEPSFVGKYHVVWRTGKYIGDTFEVRITDCPSMHEEVYTGYC